MKKENRFSGIGRKLGKYKYPVLVLLLGVALMLLPHGGSSEKKTETPVQPAETGQTMEERLEEILGQISGAGAVRVMLTTKEGERTYYQENADTETDADGESARSGTKTTTVVLSRGSGNQEAIVRQVVPPTYQGAVVVCQGADDPSVRLAVVQAVSNLTGLGADRVSVVKMK